MSKSKTMRWTWGLVWGLALGLLPMGSRAEEAPGAPARHTVVLASPGLLGEVGLGVEHAVSRHVALAGGVMGLWSFEERTGELSGSFSRRLGLSVDPGLHVYLAGRAPEGFWVGAHAEGWWERDNSQSWSREGGLGVGLGSSLASLRYGASARAGYTLVLAPGFSAQVGLGLLGLVSPPQVEGLGRAWSVSPRMTLSVGWAFGGA